MNLPIIIDTITIIKFIIVTLYFEIVKVEHLDNLQNIIYIILVIYQEDEISCHLNDFVFVKDVHGRILKNCRQFLLSFQFFRSSLKI